MLVISLMFRSNCYIPSSDPFKSVSKVCKNQPTWNLHKCFCTVGLDSSEHKRRGLLQVHLIGLVHTGFITIYQNKSLIKINVVNFFLQYEHKISDLQSNSQNDLAVKLNSGKPVSHCLTWVAFSLIWVMLGDSSVNSLSKQLVSPSPFSFGTYGGVTFP